MSARIATDIFTEHFKNLNYTLINYRLAEAKITLSGVTTDLMTPGRAFIYDDSSTPYISTWVFYGIFEATADGTTVDEVLFSIVTDCGYELIRIRIVAVNPLRLNKGVYGIMLAYEYRAPQNVPVSIK